MEVSAYEKIIVILIAMTQIVLLSSCDPTDESDSPIISQSIEVSPAKQLTKPLM